MSESTNGVIEKIRQNVSPTRVTNEMFYSPGNQSLARVLAGGIKPSDTFMLTARGNDVNRR